MSLELFTIHHKCDPQLEIFRRHFLPLQVGCAIAETDLGVLRDDLRGQLSARNRNYCELTAFDEIVHSARAEYVGVMHYRRMFTAPKQLTLKSKNVEYRFRVLRRRLGLTSKPVERHVRIRIRSVETLEAEARALNNYLRRACGRVDIITPLAVKYDGMTLRALYARAHPVAPYDRFLQLLSEMHPQLTPFIATLEHSQSYYLYNIFVMRRELFARYWEILSSTLLALEQEIDLQALDAYQSRVFGFLAERFMAIFLRYICVTVGARAAELPVAELDLME